jgi:hypothetical protein
MSIMPEGEDLRKAVKWISEMQKTDPGKSLGDLISEASLRFDLPPNDEDFLIRCFVKKEQDCD